VTRTSSYRVTLFALSLLASIALVSARSSAALDMVVGAHVAVPNKTIADCGVRAQAALNSVLQNAIKAGDDGANWLAFGKAGGATQNSAAVIIHCLTTDNGYVATFTCSAEVPPNPVTASDLCTKITAAFGGAS
jgi:hypothetical protein